MSDGRPKDGRAPEAEGPPYPRLHALAAPMVATALLSLVVGSLLLVACTPTTSTSPCTDPNGTCLPSGYCPYAPYGVVVLSVALLLLVLGIVGLWGRRPEGEELHPEHPPERREPDTALTRLEREAREHEEERRRLQP